MYWTKSPGTGGSIGSEADFFVEEIPLKKFLVKYQRSASGVAQVTGPYFLYLLKKKGLTTKEALGLIARKYSTRRSDIGYAGLKDKFAVTSQYITMKNKVAGFKTDEIELEFVAPCQNMMSVGELESNRFRIVLRGCKKAENAKKTVSELKTRGMPNYFGPQRFGVHADNHNIGLCLLTRDFDSALDMINKNYRKKYASLKNMDKKALKFFIHAYQSYVFNKIIEQYMKKNKKPCYDNLPIPGLDTKPKGTFGKSVEKTIEEDGITLESFRINELGMACTGGTRSAFVDVKNISCEISKGIIVLDFELPKGSYATVLVREVVKDGRR